MAVDHIENNELTAPSRIGYNSFVNDMYASGTKVAPRYGISDQDGYANLFGSANKKKFVARITGKWSSLSSDCSVVDQSIATIEADTEALIKKMAGESSYNAKRTKLLINENQTAVGELKKAKAQNCAGVEAEKKAVEEQKFQEQLQKTAEASVEAAKKDTAGLKSNKNLLLIGGGILALGVVAFLIFRKKK